VNNEFKLAMQLTLVDMLSGAAQVARRNILSMGTAGKEVARDFDLMQAHATRGLKAIAVAHYGLNKIKPGVSAAADMQEATLDVKMNLKESGQNAAELARQLVTVRATANQIQKQMPFGAQEVMGTENVLLKAGLKLQDVTAKGGAAWASSALAAISKEAPAAMGEGLVKIASPFNLKGGQYAELAEFIAKVDQASVTSVPELVEGMKYVAGNAAQLKVDWKEILQAQGVLAQSGLVGSIGGTSLNDFLDRLNGHSRETRKVMKGLNSYLQVKGVDPLEFWDKDGKLKKIPAIIKQLRGVDGVLNDKQKSFVFNKIFGEQGARAAFALIKQGAGSWEEIGQGIGKAAPLIDKLGIRLEGLTASIKTLEGTMKTSAATIFDPWLAKLTGITRLANDATDALGRMADKHPTANNVVQGVGAAGLAGIAGFGLYNLAKGGIYGKRVLDGIGGLKSLGRVGLGIAEGKAVQAATGVQPVFVTNWPNGSVPGVSAPVPALVGAAGKALPWVAIGAGAAATAAAAGVPISMVVSHQARENGWASRTFTRADREYEVMGIGRPTRPTGREPKNDVKIDIHFDELLRPFTRTGSMNTDVKINSMGRGDFFSAIALPGN
jgi:TP901 family phage tail tape measure protein